MQHQHLIKTHQTTINGNCASLFAQRLLMPLNSQDQRHSMALFNIDEGGGSETS